MFVEHMRRAIAAAPKAELHRLSGAVWKAYAGGAIGENDAQALAEAVEARKAVPTPTRAPTRVGSRPRSSESMARRRRWAACGMMPPQVASHFTLAMDIYGQLLREAGPIGVGTYDWYEVLNDYSQGAAAIATDSSNFATTIGDPAKSRVAGKTTFTSLVADPGHPVTPYMSCWQACINAKSARKQAAFLFMLWATSKPTAALASAAGLATTRASAWSSPAFAKAFGEQAAHAALNSLSTADIGKSKAVLFHPQAPQILDAFAIATNEIVTGNVPAKEALSRGAQKANAAIRL